MFKDFSGAVHLSQDDDHLIVYELLKLPQVTHHLHLQLCSDLKKRRQQFREEPRLLMMLLTREV